MEMRLLKPMMRLETKLVCFLKIADLVIRWDNGTKKAKKEPHQNISPCLDGQNDEVTNHWKQGHQEH